MLDVMSIYLKSVTIVPGLPYWYCFNISFNDFSCHTDASIFLKQPELSPLKCEEYKRYVCVRAYVRASARASACVRAQKDLVSFKSARGRH